MSIYDIFSGDRITSDEASNEKRLVFLTCYNLTKPQFINIRSFYLNFSEKLDVLGEYNKLIGPNVYDFNFGFLLKFNSHKNLANFLRIHIKPITDSNYNIRSKLEESLLLNKGYKRFK